MVKQGNNMILNTHIKKVSLFLMIGIVLTITSCDERIAVDEDANYTITITQKAFVGSTYSSFSDENVVGEDVVGEAISTLIEAKLTDEDGKAIKDKTIYFSCRNNYGSTDIDEGKTGEDGTITVVYTDGAGDGAVDIASTSTFEGVTVTAKYSDKVTADATFNVYSSQNDVWPYGINISADKSSLLLDGNSSNATISVTLANKLGTAGGNMTIEFYSDKGGYDVSGSSTASISTDTDGKGSIAFDENNTLEDLGLATLVASYTHTGFGATVSDTAYISISDIYTVQMNTYSGAFNENDEFVLVGEDIAGDYAQTLLIASVIDTANNPVSGVELTMATKVSGSDVGSITYLNSVTDSEGLIRAYFDDGGNSYSDTPGTPSFEGVVASASYGNNDDVSVQFNVYDHEDVWPYSLIMTSDVDVIYIDGGETKAKITSRLLNAMGNPVENVLISYESTLGFIPSVGNETDSTGVDSVEFTDLGDPTEVGVSEVTGSFIHPGFPDDNISNSLEIYIEDQSFQACAFIEIPPSNPGQIVVRDGGGVESTTIKAEIYDDAGNLIDTPTPVTFKLNPVLAGAYLEDAGESEVTIYTVNGIATVSVNSGTEPGVIRIEVDVDCDEDGNVDLSASKSQAIIAAGAPYHIEPEYDPQSTESIGGGFYQTEVGAIVYDKWYNPVECSTYVYWTIAPTPPDTLIDAFVQGISYTCNENMSSDTYDGVAYSSITYSTDAIGDIGLVSATTFGANGDTITAQINEGDGDAVMFFVPGALTLLASTQYWDFTLPTATDEAEITITAMLIDYYGNPVVNAPIAFSGMGVSEWREVGYESYTDGSNDLALDGCFTWRDYGADDDPESLDMGTFNDLHDAFDTTGNGEWDVAEVSEEFLDYGLDGIDATFDEGEGNGEWDGYPMIDCGPLVLTDKDGFARITAVFPKELCLWQSTDDESGLCTFEDFTGSISANLMIPQQTASDPLDIQLVRSQTDVGCP